MTLGVVPVVTDIPGNRPWVEHGLNGFLFPVGDNDRLAEIVGSLLDDPNLRMSIGRAARETTIARADWKVSSKLFLDSLKELEE
jgi:glycosyltransferase involved in cell wall biosynthesis